MFPNDILAGMILIVSLVLFLVAVIGYRRYRIKGMIFSSIVFLLFFIESLIYILIVLFNLKMDIIFITFLLNLIILFFLYFAISLKR